MQSGLNRLRIELSANIYHWRWFTFSVARELSSECWHRVVFHVVISVSEKPTVCILGQNMEVAGFSETLITRCQHPEDHQLKPADSIFWVEDGDSRFLRNVGIHGYTISKLRRPPHSKPADSVFWVEDKGSMFLRNVGHKTQALQTPERPQPSFSPLWNPQIS
jgi:hypothetical protein